jgi:hypothetical protein
LEKEDGNLMAEEFGLFIQKIMKMVNVSKTIFYSYLKDYRLLTKVASLPRKQESIVMIVDSDFRRNDA